MTIGFPVYRKAEFMLAENHLKKAEAKEISQAIRDKWASMIDIYTKRINQIDGIDDTPISLDTETTRVEEEGDTAYIVDNPVIIAKWKSFNFKIRTTIAVCYKESSTKNWTRVSLEDGISLEDNSNLDIIKKLYDEIANICCEINHRVFATTLEELYDRKAKSVGDFTIITFGVRDKQLGKYLELFDDVDLRLKELFTNESAKNLIENYFKDLHNRNSEDFHINDKNNYWIKSSSNVLDEDNYLLNSNVLYNINVKKNGIFAFGLGADESVDGSLANLSSLKLAKFYAKEI